MTECYVCYESCDDLAPCLCKTMYVHPSCIVIMKMYGKTECGVCKTPYPGPQVEPICEEDPNFMPDIIEENGYPPTPCLCFIMPTFYRIGMYRVTEYDKLLDIIRYMLFFAGIMLLYHFMVHPFSSEIDDDWVPSFVFFMAFLCVCSTIAQKLKNKRRSLRLQRRRAAVVA